MDDILAVAGGRGYLWWLTVDWQPFSINYLPYSVETSALAAVLANAEVQLEISKMSESARCSSRVTIERVLAELSHNFSPRSIPHLGYLLSKVFYRLYRQINVDVSHVRSLMSPEVASVGDVPTLYLPTHRSYMDFLLLPWLCFHYRLKLPVVAAAIDFSSMAVVAGIMRRCGAFFIRRRVSDRLYAAILRAYVQHLTLTCPLPMEFFLEGTRSRTGKSLSPKTGLLQVFIEMVESGRVPDVNLVPISISYDRVLEENLFAREMLGVPKPKESTGALFRALGVLSEDYGRAHVKFHAPISLRRTIVHQSPVQVALSVLQCHVTISHCTCTAIIASACLLLEGTSTERNSLCFGSVVRLARFICASLKLLRFDGSLVDSEAKSAMSVDDISEENIERTLAVSRNIFTKTGNILILNNFTDLATLATNKVDTVPLTVLQWAATRIRLQCYSNTVLSAIAAHAVYTLSTRSGFPWSLSFLVDLLLHEFPVLFGCHSSTATPGNHQASAGVFKPCDDGCGSHLHRAVAPPTSDVSVCPCSFSTSTSGSSSDTSGSSTVTSGYSTFTSGPSAETSGFVLRENSVKSSGANKQIARNRTDGRSNASVFSQTPVSSVNRSSNRDGCKQRSFTFEDVCCWMILPYMHAYLYILQAILKNFSSSSEKISMKQLHLFMKHQLSSAELDRYQHMSASICRYQLLPSSLHLSVSQDVISNCLNSLVRLDAASKCYSDQDGTLYRFSATRLMAIHEQLYNLLQRSCCCCCCNYDRGKPGALCLLPHTEAAAAKL